MMTGRECLLNLLDRKPADRLCWTTLADRTTRSVMPPPWRDMSCLDFYRAIDCDVMQFGNFDLPKDLCVPLPARSAGPPCTTETVTEPSGLVVRRTRTPWGTLVATSRKGHPIKHPVETIEELRILKNVWAGTRYEPAEGHEAACGRLLEAIGERGVYLPTLKPSPVQQLIELDMGLAAFCGFLQEHRGELDELIDLMHERRMQEYEIVASRTPAVGIIPVENTSTTLISPALYRRYSLPQIRDFVRVCRNHGKKAVLHMCGKLRGLLGPLKETGLDGINGLTPPPIGDLPFDEALDALGDDLIILGGILEGDAFLAENATREMIGRALDRTYTPRLRNAAFLLWAPADGIPLPIERFLAVRDWMQQHGRTPDRPA